MSEFVLLPAASSRSDDYQAYACGAGPPGPGKISSKRFNVSSVNSSSSAAIDSSSCATVRGPMIGAVTIGFCSIHANATIAGDITGAWDAAGLPTERNYLRDKIRQARKRGDQEEISCP